MMFKLLVHTIYMKIANSKSELVANFMIVIVSVILVAILAHKYLFPDLFIPTNPSTPVVGSKVSLSDFDFSQRSKNVLLVLRKGCGFCTESAAFYQRLLRETENKGVTFIAVLPDDVGESEVYLRELGIDGIAIKKVDLARVPVPGTPTIIVVDSNGVVSKFWVGQLSPTAEMEVINELLSS